MRPDQLTRRWESAVSRFNADPLTRQLPKMGMHGLRHTFASHMLAAGVPVPTVSEMLGHDSHVLLSVYAHTLPSAQRDALDKLAAFRRRPDADSARSVLKKALFWLAVWAGTGGPPSLWPSERLW